MKRAVPVITLLFCFAALTSAQAAEPPAARRDTIVDLVAGRAIADPYRWMEDTNSLERAAWVSAQNAAAERYAEQGTAETAARILSYSRYPVGRSMVRAGRWLFELKSFASSPDSGLYVRDADGRERRLDGRDISTELAAGPSETTSAFYPSPDGKLVLTHTTPRDASWGEFRLIDVASGRIVRRITDVVHRFSGAAWLPDGSAIVISAFDHDGDAPVRNRVILIDAKSGAQRTVVPPMAASNGQTRIQTPLASLDRNRIFVEARDGSESDLYTMELPGGGLRKLSDRAGSWLLIGSRGESAWVYSNAGSPNGRIIRIDHLDGKPTLRTIVPEGKGSIAGTSSVGGNAYGMFDDRIVFKYDEKAIPNIRIVDLDGRQIAQRAIPPNGSIWGGFSGDGHRPEAFFSLLGLAEPSTIYRLDLKTGKSAAIEAPTLPFAPTQFVAKRIFVKTSDGVEIPVLIAHRKGLVLDRPHPLILYGYGAFGWVSFLWYQPQIIEWMLHDDGVFAVAGVRGGGEYGESWHKAGIKRHRQVPVDDYLTTARYLIDRGYTSNRLLIANSSSLSGSVVGAAINQHPELFGGALLDYPLLDMIRYPRFLAARYFMAELGSPDDPEDLKVLAALSPYHNIKDGTCYPATIVRAGEHDTSVTPIHAFKYAARLQAAQSCNRPVLLDVMENAGHNYGGTLEEIAKAHAVALQFLRRALGLAATMPTSQR